METNYINEGFKVLNNLGDEEIIQIPYNLNNILIEEADIIKLLDQFNVKIDKVHNIELIRQSFTHKSYCKKTIYPNEILEASKKELGYPKNLLELRDDSYERLEYFGDRVLKVIVSFYLFNRYEKENEGFMTKLQTKIEDKKNLPIMSREIGLGRFFIISKSIENMNGRNLDKIHEDVFEAFLGALFFSNGFEICLLLIVNLLETLIDYSEKLYCDNNYKDILLKHHHTNDWTHPKYSIIYMEGPPHKRKYIVGVEKHISDKELKNIEKEQKYIGFGIGNSHKEGEQNAAKMALIIYGTLKDDQYINSDIYYPPWNKINDGETNILNSNHDTNSNHDANDIIDMINRINTMNINENNDINDNDINDNISIYSEKSV
jgi:dsRNA-specific ribonuclease